MVTKVSKVLADAANHIGDARRDLSKVRTLIRTRVSGNVGMSESLEFIDEHLHKASDEVIALIVKE